MAVMTVKVNDNDKRMLKIIASIEGKKIMDIMGELIHEYVNKKNAKLLKLSADNIELKNIMKLSEKSFNEWENDEDEIYNNL